jgi:hypothetical protein
VVARLEAALDGDPEPLLGPVRRRMAAYAAAQRYELAAAARNRLEGLTRALSEGRRTVALAAAAQVVLARPRRAGREVTVIRRGQLVAVAVLAPGEPDGVERLLTTAGRPSRSRGRRRSTWSTRCSW